jgi:hypothetical protein
VSHLATDDRTTTSEEERVSDIGESRAYDASTTSIFTRTTTELADANARDIIPTATGRAPDFVVTLDVAEVTRNNDNGRTEGKESITAYDSRTTTGIYSRKSEERTHRINGSTDTLMTRTTTSNEDNLLSRATAGLVEGRVPGFAEITANSDWTRNNDDPNSMERVTFSNRRSNNNK